MLCSFARLYAPVLFLIMGFTLITNAQSQTKPVAVIPFTTYGVHTYMQVKVNNAPKKYTFVFDTGAGGTIVDQSFVEEAGLNLWDKDSVLQTAGGINKVKMSLENTVLLENVSLSGVGFFIEDISHLTPPAAGFKVSGVIGYDLLKNFTTFINYEKGYIELYNPGTKLFPEAKRIPLELWEDIPVIPISMTTTKGKKLTGKFVFDSGASFGVNAGSPYVERHQLMEELTTKIKVPVVSGSANSSFENYVSSITELTVADHTFRDVPMNFALGNTGVMSSSDVDGVIGMEIIRRFNAVLDYEQRTMILFPNKRYHERFNFNLTGLGFTMKEGQIEVRNVMDQSPALEAGFQKGDLILSVDGVVYHNIDDIRKHFNLEGKTVTIKISRKGQAKEIRLKTKRFY